MSCDHLAFVCAFNTGPAGQIHTELTGQIYSGPPGQFHMVLARQLYRYIGNPGAVLGLLGHNK